VTQLVVFQLGADLYGVEISRVREIIRVQSVTKVPQAPAFVEGVITLRGKVIPVLDLHRRFGLAATEHTRATRIVVVEIGDQVGGIIVDRVTEVVRINTTTAEPLSPVSLLDLDRVLARDERRALEGAVLRPV
jgi:purine-binding chemotaxis protein CheW